MYLYLSPLYLFPPQTGIIYVGGVTGGLVNSTSTFDVSLDGTLTGGVADSPSEGDYVLAILGAACGNDAATVTCSADGTTAYTEVRAPAYANGTHDTRFSIYSRVQGATPDSFVRCDAGTNLTTGGMVALFLVFRPVDGTTPLDVTIVNAQGTGSNDINPPAITPTTDRALIIACGASCHLAANTTEPTRNGWTPSLYRRESGSTYTVKVAAECLVWRTGDGEIDPAAWSDPDTGETTPTWIATTLALRPAA